MKYFRPDSDNEYDSLKRENAEYQMLWASVLLQAVRDFDSRYLGEREQALNYVYSKKDHVGSFSWVCDALGLETDRIRQMCVTRDGRKRLIGNNVGNRRTNHDDHQN